MYVYFQDDVINKQLRLQNTENDGAKSAPTFFHHKEASKGNLVRKKIKLSSYSCYRNNFNILIDTKDSHPR